MSVQPQQCDARLLQRSLDDALTPQEEDWLVAHLNDCPACRERLELLAAAPAEWSGVESVLRAESTGGTENGTGDPAVTGWGTAADFAVTFLSPTDSPDALGRLTNIEIRSVIGHGGNGIVLKGFQPELNRLVAVKMMAPHLATSAAARQRFAREARAAAAIVHPAVMPILTVCSSGQLPWFAMPYVDCESLQDRLDREGTLPVADILRIGLQVAEGLAAAHAQGLVHRDVKPANILLERGVDRVMLTDFGLARAADDASLTRSGLIAGTPQYMSPEQARGDAVDHRSDLFSLGSVLYCLCTGRPPFRGETSYGILRRVIEQPPRTIRDLNPDIPVWLESIVTKLLRKSADQRLPSAARTAEILRDCLAHELHPRVNPLPAEARGLFAFVQQIPRRVAIGSSVVITVLLAILLWPLVMSSGPASDSGSGSASKSGSDSASESADIARSNAAGGAGAADSPTALLEDDPQTAWNAGLGDDLAELESRIRILQQSLDAVEDTPTPDDN